MPTYGNSKESEVERLRNRINLLESEVSKLREEVKALAVKLRSAEIPMEIFVGGIVAKPAPQITPQIPVSIPQPEIPTTSHIFFLSTPNSDGSFNNSSASLLYKEGASIYKFQNIKENQANFKIDEREASTKLAMRFPDKNIDPVCDAVNKFDPNPKSIFTVEPGLAELVGDKWRVITKARIRYES